jgi:hypothetical protein
VCIGAHVPNAHLISAANSYLESGGTNLPEFPDFVKNPRAQLSAAQILAIEADLRKWFVVKHPAKMLWMAASQGR